MRKLRDAKLYTGKIDLRKAPTKYQKGLISKFGDYLKGKAKIVTTPLASAYKKVFSVFGKDKVIVPRDVVGKGGKLKIEKSTGEIVVEKKSQRGQKRTQRFLDREKVSTGETKLKLHRRYGLPFREGRDGKMQVRWFPSKKALESFMLDYEYEAWEDFVIEEQVEFKPKYATSIFDEDEIKTLQKNSPQYKRRYTDDQL